MTRWKIAAGAERLELRDGRADLVFVVSNPGPVDDRATVDVVSSEQAQASWFDVAEPQQTVPHGQEKPFVTRVAVPQDAPPGEYWLVGRVYSADSAPEENAVTSTQIAFTVEAPAPKRRWPWWVWVAIGAGVLVVVGVVLFILLRGGTEVPDVVGESQRSAVELVEDEGLVAEIHELGSTTVQLGEVISQEPTGGTDAEKGSTVRIVVSLGDKPVQIFGLTGVEATDAVLDLQGRRLRVSIVAEASDTLPKGLVLRTDPPSGTTVQQGSDVKVVVSSGPTQLDPDDLDICQQKFPVKICGIKPLPRQTVELDR